ncbi:hypothetical protein ACLF6K_00380 [Streptomyces xanthophaeus]|uniref:hypothetical protein n=1 Tax=Streptomyces xanthophaeus TaxID=67385 RepID=UPI0039900440
MNIPLNNEPADRGGAANVTDFSVVECCKSTWVTANIFRTVLRTAALGCLVRACFRSGRLRVS